MTANLVARLWESAPRDGSRPLLVTADHTLSWDDVGNASRRVASSLVGAGVEPGDRVALRVTKRPEVLPIYLGCLRAGAVLVPFNPSYTASELAPLIGDAGPSLMISDGEATLDIPTVTPARLLSGSASRAPEPTVGGDAPAAMLFTSGTTGRAKGAVLTHGNLWENARQLADVWRFGSGDVLLHILPVFHVHGLFVALHPVLLSGATLRWHDQFDPEQAARALPGSTVMMGVPTHYGRMLATGALDRDACRTVRLLTSGSAPLPPQLFERIAAATGHRPVERYGMTETGILCSNPVDGPRVPGAVGPPLPGTELRVVGDDGEAVAPGEVGTVEVRGPQVGPGYWQRPDADASSRRADGHFITGDLGYQDDAGYVHLVGRASDLIISGGLNVYPREVESALESIDGIGEAAVIGVPHPDFGEAVIAVVTGDAVPSEESLRAQLRDRLAGFKIPKRVMPMRTLPKNAMGKTDKVRLRREHEGLFR